MEGLYQIYWYVTRRSGSLLFLTRLNFHEDFFLSIQIRRYLKLLYIFAAYFWSCFYSSFNVLFVANDLLLDNVFPSMYLTNWEVIRMNRYILCLNMMSCIPREQIFCNFILTSIDAFSINLNEDGILNSW